MTLDEHENGVVISPLIINIEWPPWRITATVGHIVLLECVVFSAKF